MTTQTQKTQSMVRTTVSRCLVVGGALVLLSFLPQACSTHDILAVNIPNVIDPNQLNSPLGAAAAELVRERYSREVTLPRLAMLFDQLVADRR